MKSSQRLKERRNLVNKSYYKKKMLKLKKIERDLNSAKRKILGNGNFTNATKLKALDATIGYLVRNGKDSGIQMEILIDIANEYQKKVHT